MTEHNIYPNELEPAKSDKNGFMALKHNQLLMIETINEVLMGNLKFVDSNRKIIELVNVRDLKTNYKYTSSQILPLPEIKTIKIIHDDVLHEQQDPLDLPTDILPSQSTLTSSTNECSSSNTSDMSKSSDETFLSVHSQETTTKTPQPSNRHANDATDPPTLNLSSTELLSLQDQLNSYTYIVQTDHRYHKALDDIRNQPVVAIVIEPIDVGRHRRTSLITIATSHAVYIFDLIALGRILRDFKAILEAEKPRKAVHFSHKMVDHLKHRHDIQLGGIFDTFVAYCITSGNKLEQLSLVDTVARTLQVPKQFFTKVEENNLQNDYSSRPLSSNQRQLVAKIAFFQMKLYEHLLHEQLLANFYKQCSNFSRSLSDNKDCVEVAMQMQPCNRAVFRHIIEKNNKLLEAQFNTTMKM